MIVTRQNYKYFLPHIKQIITKSDFIAIDLEMTGTTFNKSINNSSLDSLNFRYFKHYHSIKNFMPLQLGICCVNVEKQEFFPFSFYLFPKDSGLFNIDSSTIEFLTENGYDFNKTFYEGIPFQLDNKENNSQTGNEIKYTKNNKPEEMIFAFETANTIKTFIECYNIRKEIETDYQQYKENKNNNEDSSLKKETVLARKIKENYIKKLEKLNSQEILDLNKPINNYYDIDISNIKKTYISNFLSNLKTYMNDEIIDIEIIINSEGTKLLRATITSKEEISDKFLKLRLSKDRKQLISWLKYNSSYYLSSKNNLSEAWKSLVLHCCLNNVVNSKDYQLGKIKKSLEDLISETFLEGFNEEAIDYLINSLIKIDLSSSNTKNNVSSDLNNIIKEFKLMSTNKIGSEKINFSDLMKFILEKKKPIITHNGLLDISHIYDKFINELPKEYSTFSNSIRKSFNNELYDTKYIMESSLHLKQYFKGKTGLEETSQQILQELIKKTERTIKNEVNSSNLDKGKNTNNGKLKESENDLSDVIFEKDIHKLRLFLINNENENISDNKDSRYKILQKKRKKMSIEEVIEDNLFGVNNHDAGYDAYITSKLFIKLHQVLFSNKSKVYETIISNFSTFKNKLNYSSGMYTWDFNEITNNNKIPENNISEVFVLRGFINEFIDGDELTTLLTKFLEVKDVKLFKNYRNNNVFFTLFKNEKIIELNEAIDDSIEKGIKLDYKEKELLIIKYSDYIASLKNNIQSEFECI